VFDSRVECAWFQLWELTYDGPLSSFAFNFNLRRYSLGQKSEIFFTAGNVPFPALCEVVCTSVLVSPLMSVREFML